MTDPAPKSEEERFAERLFPKEVTIPIVMMRIGARYQPQGAVAPYVAAYALNSPSMKAPITFELTATRQDNLSTTAQHDALYEAIADHAGGELLRLASEARYAAATNDGPPPGTCKRPPPGWYCTLSDGHDGPCPTRSTFELPAEDSAWLEEHVTQFFAFEHLPPHLQEVSRPFYALARTLMKLPRNQERTKALNELLVSKDCAVRAMLAKTTDQRKQGTGAK